MTATIHLLRPHDPFANARAIVRNGTGSPEVMAAALEVLAFSTDPNDIATVRYMREVAPLFPAAPQAETPKRPIIDKLAFLLCSIAVLGGVLGGVLMEGAITAAVAGGW